MTCHCVCCGWYADSPITTHDGGGLCLGCANGRESEPAPTAPVREPQGGNWEGGVWVPCDHPNGTYPDGSCVDCGYC